MVNNEMNNVTVYICNNRRQHCLLFVTGNKLQ